MYKRQVALAYALIEKEKAYLYLRKEAVSQEVIDELLKDQIEVKDYFDIYEDIKNINGKVLLDTKSVNYTLVNSINIDNVIDQTNPSQLLKSIKNDTEIKATKMCIRDRHKPFLTLKSLWHFLL